MAGSVDGDGAGSSTASSTRPSVASYVGKIKSLTTGLPATAAEVVSVEQDPNGLGALVDTWMATDAFKARLLTFYGAAFQQTDVGIVDLNSWPASPTAGWWSSMMANAARSSFPLTVESIVENGEPFTNVLTTQSYMVTPALLAVYLFIDGVSPFLSKYSNPQFKFGTQVIPVSESIDPNSPYFLQWTFPSIANVTWADSRCRQDPVVVSGSTTTHSGAYTASVQAMTALAGLSPPGLTPKINGTYVKCGAASGWESPFVSAAANSTYRLVRFRTANPGEAKTMFYDTNALLNATEVVVEGQRTGFMDTIAFQAWWQTNDSNLYRVTMNQALIVALGQSFDGADQTKPLSLAALDSTHSEPNTPCYGCHVTLDPMRQFFLQSWSWWAWPQRNAALKNLPGQFAWDGVQTSGNGTQALATNFATSPRFATSWTQKVCTFFRSSPCDPTDSEFVTIAAAFKANNYNFRAMVRDLLVSPLVTFAEVTQTEQSIGQSFSVAKKAQFCDMLAQRLELNDPCGLAYGTSVATSLRNLATVATVLPSDGYSRGAVAPTQANDPTMMFSAGMENACKAVATVAVDGSGISRYSSSDPTDAIADMVHTLMGIDATRDSTALAILTDHYQESLAANASASDSLRSVFVLACLSPTLLAGGL